MKNIISTHLIQDRDVEKIVGKLLRFGVITASLVVLLGGILFLVKHGAQGRPDYHIFKGEENDFITFDGIFKGLFTFKPMAIIQFGVLLLIITPILRIIFSLFAFILEKDKLYVVITLIVLAIILGSTFGGLKI
ncbi:DUF1634 domain-containing protein [Pedobacter suwonensis]|uniref:DUF1634 domain-containing protein n=1 Tax=Pedobacter suwonensis TaxID=332999 RepID=UPI0011A6E602|nr:DUF1634 domain-containing protein [Pedobacter suwonensis]